MKWRWLAAIFLVVAAILLSLWLARAMIAARFARSYFQQHGVESNVEIGSLGLSGVSGRFALGPKGAPDIAAERIELHFDPLRWLPYVVEVRLVNPVVRVRLDADGKPNLGSLQAWIDSLKQQQGKSQFVSDDLAVSLTGLRLLLATPGGALEVGGDVKLVKNLPVTATLRARPTTITWQGTRVALRAADLVFDNNTGHLAVHFQGGVNTAALSVSDLEARLSAEKLKWWSVDGRISVTVPAAHLQLATAALASLSQPKLDMTIGNFSAVVAGNDLQVQGDVKAQGDMGLDADLASVRATDPALASAITQNLKHLQVSFAGHAAHHGKESEFALTAPLTVTGARGGKLNIPVLHLSGATSSLNAALEASLSGAGLPAAQVTAKKLVWIGGGLTGDAALKTHFNFAMLRGADLATSGAVSYQAGRYAFTPAGCGPVSLKAFHPGASDLATDIRVQLCGTAGKPLVTGEGLNWKLSGEARGASANLAIGNVRVEKAAAHLDFEGQGAPLRGTVALSTAEVSDRTAPIRFKPLLGSGTIALEQGIWRGRIAVTDPQKNALGETTFAHTMASGSGTAHINAPGIVFAPGKLQPESISPMLALLRRAEGTAAFSGDVNWTKNEITSQGKLTVASLDFMTVLGKAHAVKSEINFTSLLPPATAPGQSLNIARIDWTLPFSAVDVRFGFNTSQIQLTKADTDIAQGHVSLGAITLSLAHPGQAAGAAEIKSIALDSLVSASNLGAKIKLEGKVSGNIPFAVGPEGFHITNGKIAADGPGRLSVNRSLWHQGEAALSSNAVQEFAYQALEYLAFDQMSAELNSVENGRLKILFHIKGKSDPPQHQEAKVAITDIINGTALYKPIPLPSGTPIDLTLDTSLNFDELLKSYTEAWSNSLRPEGTPDTSTGAKP
ncbi:MAG: YdbH domain-containing protein [Alphaproteobacteria bacterium]|nr:YdbH domain-containing protein [Alphaproteobacteria bacterium]